MIMWKIKTLRQKERSLSWKKVSKQRDIQNRVWNIAKIIVRFLVVRSFERFISIYTIFASRVYLATRVVNYSNELLFSNAMIRERWGK